MKNPHPVLLCPNTSEPLVKHHDFYHSSKTQYPTFFGIPWIYREPLAALAHWQKKIQDVFDYSAQQLEQIAFSLEKSELLPATKTRLSLLQQGHNQFIKHLKNLLAPLANAHSAGDIVSLERVPRQQSALAYQSTLFRDWVWGQKQIEIYGDLLLPHLQRQKRLAFLGAGACGLPLYIHNQLRPDYSLAADINPFLLIPAKRLLNGESLPMVEFPQVPKLSEQVYVEHTLQLKSPTAPGFDLVFCDAQNLSCRQAALDTVVTSWFIDIVPRDFREMAKVINLALPLDGIWANIGQLGFDKFDLSQIYRPDEIKEILLEAGFTIEHWKSVEVPYLRSPYDAVGRQDFIWAFIARKKTHSQRPPAYNYWPQWLDNKDQAIPFSLEVQNFKTRSAVYNMVIAQVDGRRSLNEIAKNLNQQLGLSYDDALGSVFNFFANFYESQIYREF